MTQVVVLIPVYKDVPDSSEITSIRQTLRILGQYPIVFLGPHLLNSSSYQSLCIEEGVPFVFSGFDSRYFKGIEGYNRLLLSSFFYERFSDYEYALIAQPDVYIFRNDLDQFLQYGYDYYGAPLIDCVDEGKITYMFEAGGNGGFSLRNIKSAMRVFKTKKRIYNGSECWQELKKFHKGFELFLFIPIWILMLFGFRNNVKWYINRFGRNEDLFWTGYANQIDHQFKPAPVEVEIGFSWEKFPGELYKLNNKKLPMGCHAWLIRDPIFWKPFIH